MRAPGASRFVYAIPNSDSSEGLVEAGAKGGKGCLAISSDV